MRFVAWSDIHWHDYPSGISAEDIDGVEVQLEAHARANSVDFYLFAGDRFQNRHPADHVKIKSDVAMARRTGLGIPGIVIVGNHDFDDMSVYSGHTYRIVEAFPGLFPNLIIADKAGTYPVDTKSGRVLIHALPAGAVFDMTKFAPDPKYINILVFHGLLKGAHFDVAGEVKIKEGYTLGDIDRPEFDLVLGGDVHIPQSFELRHTRGGYIGSTLQLNIGDAGSPRGFLDVEIHKGQEPKLVFVSSVAPQFYRVHIPVLDIDGAINGWRVAVAAGDATFDNCIVHVTLEGPNTILDMTDEDEIVAKISSLGKVKSVRVKKQADLDIDVDIPELRDEASSPVRDAEAYVRSGKVDLEDMDADKLCAVGRQLIGSV